MPDDIKQYTRETTITVGEVIDKLTAYAKYSLSEYNDKEGYNAIHEALEDSFEGVLGEWEWMPKEEGEVEHDALQVIVRALNYNLREMQLEVVPTTVPLAEEMLPEDAAVTVGDIT
jgi:hypothetical protein